MGLVGWRTSPLLTDLMAEIGVNQAPYRRTLRLNEASDGRYIGEDLGAAAAHGMETWLTVVGTPRSLSPFPDAEGNQYGTGLPEFARYPPVDALAWADALLTFIDETEINFGVVPDYVEIWNEPERVEWFKGSGNDLLELYAVAATRIRSIRPGIRVGGPGLAGWRSEMGMGESMLFALVRQARLNNLPLDFVSWHHYAPSTELVYSKVPLRLRQLGASLGLSPFATVVSEWNIYPSAEGAAGPEFDGPHAAANLGGFLISARQTGLDHGLFFLDRDEDDNPGITDLLGSGLGLVTQHGIKKPSARLLEIMQPMANQLQPKIMAPAEEWNVCATAAVAGTLLRIVVTNDVVTGTWVFANRARENGMDPAWLYDIWLAAGGTRADEQDLIDAGLTPEQARATLAFIPEVLLYGHFKTEPRPVVLEILGTTPFNLGEIVRFTQTVNAPAQHQAVLLPEFQAAEYVAVLGSAQATANHLTALGYPYTAADIMAIQGDFFTWAALEGIPYGYAVTAYKILQDTLRDLRLAVQGHLNNLPETVVQSEPPANAGVTVLGREIQFAIEPDTTLVIEIVLSTPVAGN